MKIIDERSLIKSRALHFINTITEGVYLFGINQYSNAARYFFEQQGLPVLGFLDDFTDRKELNGVKIYRLNDINVKSSVLNCVVNGRPVDAQRKIQEMGITNFTDYYALQSLYPDGLPEVDYLSGSESVIGNTQYHSLYDNLADEESKNTLERVINFRFNRDISQMNDFKLRIHEQYFEDFIQLKTHSVFVDGGGFDGQTTERFISACPSFLRVYYFEPHAEMMKTSQKKLSAYKNIEWFQYGLWSSGKILSFDASQGSASRISTKGQEEINVVALDDIINESINLIKLDIEGAEYDALTGAKNLIKRYRPQIAVCVYHDQNHFISIPEFLKSLHEDYRIYLRHYSQGVMETVMFFI